MTILDRANAFIGHEQEVDEGLEVTMRRNAFIVGFKEALEAFATWLYVNYPTIERNGAEYAWEIFLKDMEDMEVYHDKFRLESEVDELIKEMEG